jgi:hypothetical protein
VSFLPCFGSLNQENAAEQLNLAKFLPGTRVGEPIAPQSLTEEVAMRRATIGAVTVGLACTSALLLFATRGRDVTIPAGTTLQVMMDTTVGSDISRPEQPVRAHLARTLTVGGATVLDMGTVVSGVVTDATRSARVKGRAHVAVRFDTLVPQGGSDHYKIESAAIGRTAPGTKEKDALEIGVPAAAGAIIGGLTGGGKGAAIGTAVGGGAGTAVVLSTRGKEIHLQRGALVELRLTSPVTVRVAG